MFENDHHLTKAKQNRDASNAESVDAGLAALCDVHKLPPVGGVAYGPLVLKDALLDNMDLETMNIVLKSKVPGAKIFHDRFCDPEKNPLDFFVMFSSAALFGGNPGQTNYTAANAYLQALGQNRRSKGLAVSGFVSFSFSAFLSWRQCLVYVEADKLTNLGLYNPYRRRDGHRLPHPEQP